MASTTVNEDNLVTLDEALAFINFCDEEIEEEAATSTAKVQDFHVNFTLEEINALLNDTDDKSVSILTTNQNWSSRECQSPTKKKKRAKSAASSSTQLQRRKKFEIKTLREEAEQLEAYLTKLNADGPKQNSFAVTKGNDQFSKWHRHALEQYQQRYQSEQMNRQLKELVAEQWKMSTKLRGVLHKRNVLDGMEFVRTFESTHLDDSRFSMNYASLLMNQLEYEVEGVYRNFNQIYHEPIINCSTQTTYVEKCQSSIMEFSTRTPMDWPMKAAFKFVWDFLDSSSDRSRKPNTLETKVNLTLPLPNSPACHFHKVHFLRKYEEPNRIVVIWSDLMQMTSKNIRLRSIAHAVFTPSESDPLKASVMETYLKLYVEPTEGEDVSSEDIQYGRDVVLGVFGRLMRKFWQDQQTHLLEVTSHSFVSV